MFAPPPFPDHALLDSGAGQKLERLGAHIVRRPDPRALWRPRLEASAWAAADLAFELDPESGGKRGAWTARASGLPEVWTARWEGVRFCVRPGSFRHLGIFPEQAANWRWLLELAATLGIPPAPLPPTPGRTVGERLHEIPHPAGADPGAPRLLNLFGYTGIASVVAHAAGFRVTHVDASRAALGGLKENLAANLLPDDAVRILLDDCLAFARREVRRKASYACILLDPPHHGSGPKGESWQLEEHMAPLLEACAELLEPRAGLVLSTYATTTSPLGLESLLASLPGGSAAGGELALVEEPRAGLASRALPCGACARWTRGLAP